jgi:hypothetical protein
MMGRELSTSSLELRYTCTNWDKSGQTEPAGTGSAVPHAELNAGCSISAALQELSREV